MIHLAFGHVFELAHKFEVLLYGESIVEHVKLLAEAEIFTNLG
jgi:hypothetical protein